jgi:hypothetical protein
MVDALERIIVRAVKTMMLGTADNLTRIEFTCSTNDDESEDIVSFTEILNRIE